jgi:3',5'-cyclic AMP phosphodiesterase CpdA
MKRSVWLLGVLLVGVSGCLRAAEERAERDRQVGQAESEQISVSVVDGLAVVRALDAGEITLWESAPRIDVHLTLASGAPTTWDLHVKNAMPDAELRLDGAPSGAVVSEPEALPTRKSWRLALAPGENRITIGPPDANDSSEFRFALLSDIQEAIDRLVDIHHKIDEDPSIRFLLGAGDLTQQGTAAQLARYQRELESLNVPYYTTLGNHELGTHPCLWQDTFGRGSFRFLFHGVQFTMLDDGSAGIDPIVYGWLDGWLAEGRDRVNIVAMHIPAIDPIGVRNGSFASRNEAAKFLAKLAEGRVDMTLYGHIHSNYAFDNAGIPAHISGGGGAIPERFDGIGRHFMVFDVGPVTGVKRAAIVRVD